MRNQRENFLCDRADSSRVNHVGLAVKGELCSACSSCRAGCRIINIAVGRLCLAAGQGLNAAEITIAKVIGWDCKQIESAPQIVNSKNVPKEEQLVPDNWPAYCAAVIVISGPREGPGGTIEKVARCQRAHAVELVRGTVEVIRS